MKTEEYATRIIESGAGKIRLKSYRLGNAYFCTADNVDPGAWLARAQGASREEAEERASKRALELLGRTRRAPTG
jgi:hypothetical protein